jgi:hypothetical protein
MHVDRNLPVTPLLGTVVRRHLEGQMRAQTYPRERVLTDITTHNTTPDGSIIHRCFQFESVSTIQGASQHTCAEDGYLKRPRPPNIGGDIWLDRWLVSGRTWVWRCCVVCA